MEDLYREVDFRTYCPLCKHSETSENGNPCCECLDYNYNQHSAKPVEWEEK